ncbi:hypothetical protein N4T77_09880 [Clostridium sp. CX1]|uniref:Uncharacterized protein n=1 Tax=Clostridium tanneri TaxID=3037988 RepID=A0ABU4JSJ0_9CLOT|nr:MULTISPECIES: hypothetical protein [unclassified Clostridium]MCT8976911.1 hypothetical protein [Clostridium sp. CX1]MDW8801118.1 hypothetical protein [Clostridium sp. A1-XYC3]
MNATVEKVNTANITESKIEKTKEVEKKSTSLKDQFCLKTLDYFIF